MGKRGAGLTKINIKRGKGRSTGRLRTGVERGNESDKKKPRKREKRKIPRQPQPRNIWNIG